MKTPNFVRLPLTGGGGASEEGLAEPARREGSGYFTVRGGGIMVGSGGSATVGWVEDLSPPESRAWLQTVFFLIVVGRGSSRQ